MNPRHTFGFLIWKVSRLCINDMNARLASTGMGVSVEQIRPLFPLYRVGPLSQGKLCDLLSQEKTGVSRLVANLERRGLVVRVSQKEDRRAKDISITQAGRDVVEAAHHLIQESYQSMTDGIDPEDMETCKRVLWQIIAPTLDRFVLDDAGCGLNGAPVERVCNKKQ